MLMREAIKTVLIFWVLLFPAFSFSQVNASIETQASQIRVRAAINQNKFVRHIALPLESVLIQGIPARNESLFRERQILRHSHELFVVRPLASQLLVELKKLGYEITIFSALSNQELVRNLLSQFRVPLSDRVTTLVQAARFVGIRNLETVKVEDLGIDDRSSIVVTTSESKSLVADYKIDLGNSYFAFPSFEASQNHRQHARPEIHSSFAPNEVEYHRENLKLGYLFQVLILGNRDSHDHLTTTAAEIFSQNMRSRIPETVEFLNGQNGYVRFTWQFNQETKRATGCTLRELYQLNARTLSPEVCLEIAPFQNSFAYVYTKQDRSTCSAFTRELFEISNVEVSKCQNQFVYFNRQSRSWISYAAFAGMASLTDEELVQRLGRVQRPTPQDPVRLFQPERDFRNSGRNLLSLQSCLVGFQSMRTNNSLNLLEECKPDTLYSWGTMDKLNSLKTQMGRSHWRLSRTLYTSRGPITTFGYGDIPVRVKLKPGVRFVRSGYLRCDGFNSDEARTSVYFRQDQGYSDWTICHSDVIHSWSHSSEEHYDEMIKDYQVMKKTLQDRNRIVGTIEIYFGEQLSANSIFTNGTLDGRSIYSESRLLQIFSNLAQRVLNSSKEVFVNPSINDPEAESEHFKTSKPIHFNEE